MYNKIFKELKEKLIRQFDEKLKPGLLYHNSFHTLDVVNKVEHIARMEGIEDEETIFLLKIGALFHDSGFLEVYNNHEEKSCIIMRKEMEPYGFSEEKLRTIEQIIMATKMPQTPHNHIEQIMCDADLDYLGRNDFGEISNRLKIEMLTFGILKTEKEWDQIQLNFFEKHHYFTRAAQKTRKAGKDNTLKMLRNQSKSTRKPR